MNAFSVDLEDWFCAYNHRIGIKEWDNCELRVVNNTRLLLNIFERHNVKATFFVLGWIAQKVPELIREIEENGHEIACHGFSHIRLMDMTHAEFDKDIEMALSAIANCTKYPVIGFRAPSFSITKETLWAIEILINLGFKYDSSVFPISFHPDYGISDSNTSIHKLEGITEFPLSIAEIMHRRIPCGGGGYFRLYPYNITKYLLKKCNKQGRSVIFYIHPWELDTGQPKRPMPMLKKFRHYNNISKTEHRLNRLFDDFKFVPIKNLISL
jgi:polysaccharide deacetylase family protein (PEP-CTERM system associated)